MGMSDPRYQIIAEFMKTQPGQKSGNVAEVKQSVRSEQFIARYKRIKNEYKILMERNDILASALGACLDCWGEDADCEMCYGKGVPGAYVPDRDAFVEFVLPSLRRLRVLRRKEVRISNDSGTETKPNAGGEHNNMNQSKEV